MAGKNAYLRYRIIDECLNSNKRYDSSGLLERISERLDLKVSKSTLDKDLKAMKEEHGAPILWNKAGYYEYGREFSLTGITLANEETDALKMSLSVLDVLKETQYLKSYQSLFERLLVRSRNQPDETPFIEWEKPEDFLGKQWFDVIVRAINDRQTLVLTHQVYDKEPKQHTVSPYMIKEYRNRFYLIALKHKEEKENAIYSFGFDRIQNVKTVKQKFLSTPGFNSKDFFKFSMGITRKLDEKPLKLKLKVNAFDAHYVLSDPWHATQKIVEQTDEYLIFSLEVYDSQELDLKIRSYGAEIEVLEPKSYRRKMKETAEKIVTLYRKP
jgi:predicted DNA-binding transcriptional regulator YafY